MSEEKVKTVEAEVQRLQDAKVIREVLYPVWLVNTVPVKKKNGKWRMCVDFTDLNKACKKNDFLWKGWTKSWMMQPIARCSHSWICSRDIIK
jgi:hypothetical protein